MNSIQAVSTGLVSTLASFASDQPHIVATLIEKEREVELLVRHLGPDWLRFEHGAYQCLMRACEAYRGGLWDFFELSNGGFYMAPAYTGPMRMRCDSKGFVAIMSPEAAGIYACATTLSTLEATEGNALPGQKLAQLRDFVFQHAERGALSWALEEN